MGAIELRPGIVATESIFSEQGRWIDGDKVRFYRGRPQKIGGWANYSANAYTGYARALLAWSDYSFNNRVLVGTNCKLQFYDPSGDIADVTPIQSTGTLGTDPIATTSGDETVTITHASHGRDVGDTVIFSGATATGGITIDGSYVIESVPDTDTYTIEHSAAASSTTTGGGSAVDYQYELACGLIDAAEGGGYGIGGFGESTYGDARTANFLQLPRTWSLEVYGEDVLCSPFQGGIYQFDSTNANDRVTLVSNAPTSVLSILVTDSRYVLALGTTSAPLTISWPDQSDITDWTPASSNTAGSRTLQEGSRLIAGTVLRDFINLIWTDSAVHIWQYTGNTSTVFSNRLGGTGCGLLGPNAFVVVNGVAYWMSKGSFHMYNGSVQDIPMSDDIESFVFDNISELQGVKTFAGYIQEFNEIWFWFPVEGETEPSRYVAYNITDRTWIKGTMSRSAFARQENSAKEPLMAGTDENDKVYVHETGLNDEDGNAIRSYVTAAPFVIAEGEVGVDLEQFEPDFERQVGNIKLTATTYSHSRETSVLDEIDHNIDPSDELADIRAGGRFFGFTIESNEVDGDFRIGKPHLYFDAAGERRG